MVQNRTTQRYQEVCWCSSPIFIHNLPVADIQGECGLQVYCNEWLESKLNQQGLPLINKYSHWHHSAAENRGSGIYGLRAGILAKRSGQKRGWPDWMNCHRKIVGELKLPKGVLSEDQRTMLAYFKAIGWDIHVWRSFEAFEATVESDADL